jgi:mRNA-degrading endonuclease toxin of MazEF toxin-antitoxin module
MGGHPRRWPRLTRRVAERSGSSRWAQPAPASHARPDLQSSPRNTRPPIVVSRDELSTGAPGDLIVVVPLSTSLAPSKLRVDVRLIAGIDRPGRAVCRAVRAVVCSRFVRRLPAPAHCPPRAARRPPIPPSTAPEKAEPYSQSLCGPASSTARSAARSPQRDVRHDAVVARSLHARLGKASTAALDVVRAGGLTDSEAVTTSLREARHEGEFDRRSAERSSSWRRTRVIARR